MVAAGSLRAERDQNVCWLDLLSARQVLFVDTRRMLGDRSDPSGTILRGQGGARSSSLSSGLHFSSARVVSERAFGIAFCSEGGNGACP